LRIETRIETTDAPPNVRFIFENLKEVFSMKTIFAIFGLVLSLMLLVGCGDKFDKTPTGKELKQLSINMTDLDPAVRADAVEKIGEKGVALKGTEAMPTVIKLLTRALKDTDSSVRSSAAVALGKIGDEQAVKPLIEALKDENSSVRRSVAIALGEIGDTRAVAPLIEALGDEEVQRDAGVALGKIGEPAVNPLIAALKDEDLHVQLNAALVLEKIGGERAVEALKKHREGLRKAQRKNRLKNMVLIPAGEFQMGTSDAQFQEMLRENPDWKESWFENEKPVHAVHLDAFLMDKHEVTNEQYSEFLNAYGRNVDAAGHELLDIDSRYCLIEKAGNTYQPKAGYENHPVVMVNWYGAAAYAQFYGIRLPTEAEWEKAARGGLVGKQYPWGDILTHDNANYSGTEGKDKWDRTSPVGSFPANGYGLYDMAGNVWEWCADEYDSGYYAKSPPKNPTGPGTPILFVNNNFTNVKERRVLRGGSWGGNDYDLRCADRGRNVANSAYVNNGFRCLVAED